MKTPKKRSLTVTAIIAPILLIIGFWTYCSYRTYFPSLPDHKYYATLEERAAKAKMYAAERGMNEKYCIFVDYSIPSGKPRLFVWSFEKDKVISSTYVMHGPGKGSTAKKPVFSNKPGSNCSTLGRFEVTKKHGTKVKHSFRLAGLDTDNQTALQRGIMLHGAKWVDLFSWKDYIPLNPISCLGCVTVSQKDMKNLEKLINSQKKDILLWSFCQT